MKEEINDAPRVTIADIEAEIVSERYFTAADGVLGAYRAGGDVHPAGVTPSREEHAALSHVTFCVLILRNGAKVEGVNYGPVVPSSFDAVKARVSAREAAIDKVWPLLGFRLRDTLAANV